MGSQFPVDARRGVGEEHGENGVWLLLKGGTRLLPLTTRSMSVIAMLQQLCSDNQNVAYRKSLPRAITLKGWCQ